MKQRFKLCLLGLLFLLLNTMAMRAYTPTETNEKRSDISYIISQEEANHNAVRFLFYIYSNTPREAVSIDNQSHDLKYIAKLLTKHNSHKNQLESVRLSVRSLYSHLRPDPIGYYIYTLEKIVI